MHSCDFLIAILYDYLNIQIISSLSEMALSFINLYFMSLGSECYTRFGVAKIILYEIGKGLYLVKCMSLNTYWQISTKYERDFQALSYHKRKPHSQVPGHPWSRQNTHGSFLTQTTYVSIYENMFGKQSSAVLCPEWGELHGSIKDA